MVSQACNAVEVARWDFEETSGTTATDQSGLYVATLGVSDTLDVDGRFGSGIDFGGDDGAVVDAASSEAFQFAEDFSIVLWVKSDVAWGAHTRFIDISAADGGLQDSYRLFTHSGDNTDNFKFMSRQDGSNTQNIHTRDMAVGTWILLVLRHDLDGDVTMNVLQDGDSVDEAFVAANSESWPTAGSIVYGAAELKFGRMNGTGRKLEGQMDAVAFYDEVLTDAQIARIFSTGVVSDYPLASAPDPADGAILEATWVNPAWRAGDYAVSHDLYFGTDFDDVNDGAEGTFVANMAETIVILGLPGFHYPDGLVPGTTYYWRVDEVNDAEPNSPWKGPVWSFSIPPKNAYNLDPVDGASFVDPNVGLAWTGGFGAKLHHIYFGDSFDDVNDGTGDTYKGALADPAYTPGTLELDKTYYWRIDEFDGAGMNRGSIQNFQTFPEVQIAIADPNLVGWWKLDEGLGSVAVVDSSGYGHHGNVIGDSQWIDGYDSDALEFDGVGYIQMKNYKGVLGANAFSVSIWVKTSTTAIQELIWWGTQSGGQRVEFRIHSNGHIRMGNGSGQVEGRTDVTDGQWHHVAVTVADNAVNSSNDIRIYIDGEDDTLESTDEDAFDITSGLDLTIGWRPSQTDRPLQGSIDDVRIFDKVLTLTEVEQVMRIDLLLAWKPGPANGSTPDIEYATPLTWSPGDMASQHDVYFGTDKDSIQDANTSTADIYQTRQSGTSYIPPEGVEWGGGPYYWRIDENNSDGTVTKGRVWSFTVVDFILVDDFESYDANDNQIWYAWHDGLGYGMPDVPPYFAGNGTGAAVGDETTASYTEETIVQGGGQSMPLTYDNNKQGFAKYSEAELALTAPRDWSKHELAELSLWFRGYPASVGSFVEGPAGTYTMTASGTDITGTADQFHFAYKMLTGPGSIVAKVDSVSNTHAWAKAGVMIRETLDAGSKHAFACVTPENGVASQGRTAADGTSFNTNETGITAPYWVKLERDAAGNFTVSHSAGGTSFQPVGSSVPTNIPMSSNVYIGLALTSHNAAQTCEAVFSNVTITGTAGPQWTNEDIGIESNAADPNAAVTDIWTEWVIPLQAFADQGVNLADVDRIAIGLGTQGNMTTPGGSGTMFFDDIRLYRSRPEPGPEPEPEL